MMMAVKQRLLFKILQSTRLEKVKLIKCTCLLLREFELGVDQTSKYYIPDFLAFILSFSVNKYWFNMFHSMKYKHTRIKLGFFYVNFNHIPHS